MMENFDCWNGVNGEVLRGVKLREEKIKFYPIPNEYDVVNVALSEPSCSRTTPWDNFQSTSKRDATRQYEHSCNFTNIQKYTNVTKKRKNISKNKPFARTKTHCPLRVAELSVPTKRHCLETWRNNIDVLPSFMIERLRQIVMDEKPIVKIYDAVDCFKKQKTRRSRSTKRHVKSKQVDQLRLLCALLSYKIIHNLLQPLNLTLNSQLKKLSRIVDDEITNILKSSKKSKVHSNCKIQTEIADKITVWIASVLKDSAYMLLLEDFQELREEEGPVWDLIDELIDSVVIICEPMSIIGSIATELSISSLSKSTMNEELRIVDEASKSKYDEFISNPSDTKQIHKEDSIIAHILDNIIYNETPSPSMKSVADSIDNVDSVNSVENFTNSNVFLHEEKGSNGYLNKSKTSSVHEQPITEIDSKINNSHENEDDSTNARDNDEVIQLNVNVPDLEESMLKIRGSNREMEHDIDMTSKGKKIESTESQIDVQHEETPDDSIKKVSLPEKQA